MKVKFIQIVTTGNGLYALDDMGQVWYKNTYTDRDWVLVESPNKVSA